MAKKGDRVSCPECGAFVKSANLRTHMKSVHRIKLKEKQTVEIAAPGGETGGQKAQRGSTVVFPWKWIAVGAVALILIIAAVVVRPALSPNSNSNNGTNSPPECIEGKTIVARYTFTLHILKTDASAGLVNYTHPISYGIGKSPLNGQACTRKMYTSDVGPPYEYNASKDPAIVHVESPTSQNTLGDFFKIWDQVLNYSQGFIVTYDRANWNIVMKVNGQVYSSVWEQLSLQPNMSISFYVTKIA